MPVRCEVRIERVLSASPCHTRKVRTTPIMAKKLVVVGAGPVGCLVAIALANMGWVVEIYEARPGIPPLHLPLFRHFHEQLTLDMRLPSSQAAAQQRSINLAFSSRGIAAMKAIDPVAASRFLDNVIPMRGRM